MRFDQLEENPELENVENTVKLNTTDDGPFLTN